jgi:hypothetical protein
VQGNAGFDRYGLARAGDSNAWVRGSEGWHAVYQLRPFYPSDDSCYASAFLQGSSNVENVYLSIVDQITGEIYAEKAISGADISNPEGRYVQRYTPRFWLGKKHESRPMIVRVGFWGNGQDAWIRIDLVEVCPSNSRSKEEIFRGIADVAVKKVPSK